VGDRLTTAPYPLFSFLFVDRIQDEIIEIETHTLEFPQEISRHRERLLQAAKKDAVFEIEERTARRRRFSDK